VASPQPEAHRSSESAIAAEVLMNNAVGREPSQRLGEIFYSCLILHALCLDPYLVSQRIVMNRVGEVSSLLFGLAVGTAQAKIENRKTLCGDEEVR